MGSGRHFKIERTASGRLLGAAAHVLSPFGVDVERLCRALVLHDLAVDDDFLDALQARKVEHGLQQDAFENRTQAAGAGLAGDGPLGDGAERVFGELERDVLHLEQAFTQDALRAIADRAHEKDTGARGLRSIIEEVMLDIMYDLPDQPEGERYEITGDIVEGRGKLFKLPQPVREAKTKSA